MNAHLSIHYNSRSTDVTVFGSIAIFRGSRLVDAICELRRLARDGVRDKSVIEAEIHQIIDNERKAGGI